MAHSCSGSFVTANADSSARLLLLYNYHLPEPYPLLEERHGAKGACSVILQLKTNHTDNTLSLTVVCLSFVPNNELPKDKKSYLAPTKGVCKEMDISSSNAEILTCALHPINYVLKWKPSGKHSLRLVKQEKQLARSHLNLFETVGNQQSTPRAHFHPGDLRFHSPQSPLLY